MQRRPFESAASGLVDEGLHPVEQLDQLEEKAKLLGAEGDTDAVIECRIKQLALQRVLVHLYDFPLQPLIRAQVALAEAYAAGRYFKQSRDHLDAAHDANTGALYDETQTARLNADMVIAEGYLHLEEGRIDSAKSSLTKASRLTREVYGEDDSRMARVETLLGQVSKQRGKLREAKDHFAKAAKVHSRLDSPGCEDAVRLRLKVASLQHEDEDFEAAISTITEVVETLKKTEAFPVILIEALSQLARWLEAQDRDEEALSALKDAEHTVVENLGSEDDKVIDIKRDEALLHLKLNNDEAALQYLNEVHYLERRLHGSQSVGVARTLKALSSVHLRRRALDEAEQCLLQALRIFEADPPADGKVVRDINSKLKSIANMR